jgi:hypothetical protein
VISLVQNDFIPLEAILFGFNQYMIDTQSCPPSHWHAMQLWQVFVTNIDPIVKILHIPTMQVTLFAAKNNPNNIDDHLNAPLFAVYSTPISLTNLIALL